MGENEGFVQILRDRANAPPHLVLEIDCHLFHRAAAEIERLRAEVARYKGVLTIGQAMTLGLPPFDEPFNGTASGAPAGPRGSAGE